MGFTLSNYQFEILASERLAQLHWEQFTYSSMRHYRVLMQRSPIV